MSFIRRSTVVAATIFFIATVGWLARDHQALSRVKRANSDFEGFRGALTRLGKERDPLFEASTDGE